MTKNTSRKMRLLTRYFSANLLFAMIVLPLFSVAQEKKIEADLAPFRDTLDGAIDLSNYLINMHGFVPVPQIITQPALGNFGLAFAAVFITPNKHQEKGKYTAPNITAAFGGYTLNKSWMTGVFRMATLPKRKLKYRLGGGYASLNLDFYRTIGNLGEQAFSFNFKTVLYFF